MVFEPTGGRLESLINNSNALRIPISINIGRSQPLTTRMWETLFREMGQAGLNTDMMIFQQNAAGDSIRSHEGFDYLRRQTDRFVITSINRGSVLIEGVVILGVGGWFVKQFILPGWERSESKKHWDDGVAHVIDKAVPILKDQIDYHVVHRLKRLKIRRVALRPPHGSMGRRLADNSTRPDVELIYDKPKQIAHKE